MNITELDSFNLADAVKFNDQLNPRLWQGEKMRPEVREQLLKIAADFKESLGLRDLDVEDITVSGSNAGFTYTPHSDIDLHLVVRMPEQCDDVYQELFNAKKYQYNNEHDIKIGGYDVELYVQPADQEHVSAGVYSLKNNDWIHIPRKIAATVDDRVVNDKYDLVKSAIESALKSRDIDRMKSVWDKIKEMRKAGLAKNGELGPENLAFKMLRTQGDLGELKDTIRRARDAELSLNERKKKKKKVKYGFARTWGPVFDFGDSGEGGDGGMAEDATATPDGVNPTTQMFLNEKETPTQTEIIVDFMRFVVDELELKNIPKLKIRKDPQWSVINKSFGLYRNDLKQIELATGNRHIMDVLRTLAHELQHRKQDEREHMPAGAGETGSRFENEANAQAGVLMRKYAELHPEYFEDVPVSESASGYIPKNKKEAAMPQYAMALSVDIKPGQVGKEANKMALKTNKQGKPGLLMKTANMIGEAATSKSHGYNSTPMSQVPGEQEDDLGNQEATGPEFEPQMPAGTTKIEVGDLTDWYRLGMDISDLDDADPEDYNQGPPQTVVVFPSDEAEQGYLKQFKRLGLKTHDLDPDVAGGEDTTGKHMHESLAEELQAFKEQDLFEVKMTSGNLAKLAKAIPGATVGLEFEMIVPNTSSSDGGDQEPDYDQDERVRDIDDAVNFFDDGDFNSQSQIRRLRESMDSDYIDWKFEKLDELWQRSGFEFFQEYLDREDPFDEEEAREEATNELQAQYGDDITPEEFQKMLDALVEEKREAYVQEQWDDQGSNYEYAQEEFNDEQGDDITQEDWLDSQGIRYASDVESSYDVTWPHWISPEGSDTDVKEVALNFMNYMGYDTIAVGDYHGYGGGYELWNGTRWVNIGSNKPMDAFTVEPDGSLRGDSSGDAGLEFVSPPIPLDQISDTMKRVQQWAAQNGVYTGKQNSTSMHTNISIPEYDLDKLDYLKAAILLGDEYVLREFGRIGNSYAKPAIDKVKELVRQKPEKAQELLDKMKSQLNAAASKLIHSGQTDKYTSINTKDNRVEFRSPGGDYLSDIADNPQKMTDTINRMVVALDAALDPNKYKEEYQKKLYKLLTGQQSGREAKTGAKQEMKADDKDLLNIFSRYAAGELPKQALKSFVRQAQLQRNVAKGKTTGKMWWSVSRPGYFASIEVVASSREEAIDKAIEPGNYPDWARAKNTLEATPVRPFKEEPKGPTLNNRPSNPDGNYVIVSQQDESVPVYRFMASGDQDAITVLRQWIEANPGLFRWTFKKDTEQALGQPGAAQPAQPAATNQGNWGIWIGASQRFARQPGEYPAGQEIPLRRFATQQAAEQFLTQTREQNPRMRTDVEVREIEPAAPVPGSTLDLQRQRAAQAQSSEYELYRISDGRAVNAPAGNPIVFRANSPEDAESKIARYAADFNLGAPELFAVRSVLQPAQQDNWSQDFERRMQQGDAAQSGIIDVAGETPATAPRTLTTPGQGQQVFTGEWKIVDPDGREIHRFGGIGNAQADANRVAMAWLTRNPRQMVAGVEVVPVMG